MRAMVFWFAMVVALGGACQAFVGGDILFDLAAGARTVGMGGAGVALPSSEALFTNSAGLPWIEGVRILSTYGNAFGAAQVGAVSVALPGLAAAAIILDAGAIGPGLTFRTTGAIFGAGVRIGPVGIGLRTRILRPVAPVPGLGGALDLAFLWRGLVHVGVEARNVIARAPVPSETWLPLLTIGISLPMDLRGINLALACDLTIDSLGSPSFAVGVEFGLDWLLVRAGQGPSGTAIGGAVGWGPFGLDWGVVLHSVLPPAVRISFVVRL